MEKNQSKRERKGKREKAFKKKTSSQSRCDLKAKIKAIQIEKEGLDTNFLLSYFNNFPNFIGVFAQDQLEHLIIKSATISFVVNFDFSNQTGSHWIAIKISKSSLEIFDSLGFSKSSWDKKPKILIKFLLQFKDSHKIFITPQLQAEQSILCGVYCIFFLFYRLHFSFQKCVSIFSTDLLKNDKILLNHVLKL